MKTVLEQWASQVASMPDAATVETFDYRLYPDRPKTQLHRGRNAAYMRRYRRENAARIAATAREYNERNAERIAARKRDYDRHHRGRNLATSRAYEERNRDKRRARAELDSERHRERRRAYRERNPEYERRASAARRARYSADAASAQRRRALWTSAEDSIVLRTDITMHEKASMLARSSQAVSMRLWRLRGNEMQQ